MNEAPGKRAVIVGIFILIGIAFLGAGILAIGNLRNTFTQKIQLNVMFQDVSGLQKGNNIWFSGVKVGTVRTVRFYGQNHVKVVLNIEEASRPFIRKDAMAKISTDGLIGNKIIVIQGGSFRTEAVSDGDTIAAEKIEGPDQMMNTLNENNKNLLEITKDLKKISNRIAAGQGNIGRLIDDESIYHNISGAALSLKNAGGKADAVMSSLATFGASLNRKGTLAYSLANDTTLFGGLRSAIDKLNKTADSAAAIAGNLKRASENQKTPVGVMLHDEQAGANLKNILKNLESGSLKLDQDLEAMQHSFLLRRYFRKKSKN